MGGDSAYLAHLEGLFTAPIQTTGRVQPDITGLSGSTPTATSQATTCRTSPRTQDSPARMQNACATFATRFIQTPQTAFVATKTVAK